MNRKRISIALLIAAFIVCLLVMQQNRRSLPASPVPPPDTAKSAVTNRVLSSAGSKGTNTLYLTNLPPEMRAKIIEQEQQRRGMQQSGVAAAFLNQKNGRIDFWGLVVDQDDKPLQGVEIAMHVRQWKFALGMDANFPKFTRRTDAQGQFSLLDTAGDSLTIDEVLAPGYRLPPQGINGGSRNFPYHGMSVTFSPDPRNPVVIHMWKSKGAAAMINYSTGGPSLFVDGTPIFYDLTTGKKVEQGGHLEVRLFRDPKDAWGNKRNGFSWRTEISVPGGGLLWREDPFGYEAPADGYVPTLVMGQEANDPAWKSRIQGQFYFRTAEGYYGRIEFQQNTDAQPPPCPFYITCYLNPSGSRNLEYDSSLRIDPRKLVARSPVQVTPQPPQNFVQPAQPKPNAPVIPPPPPGFQALTNRSKAFPPPIQPRPQ
jgi:hypothetical protein